MNNLVIKRDLGEITFKSGSLSFSAPVLDRVVVAVFNGEGQFSLTPKVASERRYLKVMTEKDGVNEQFDRLVLCFTDQTYQEVKSSGKAVDLDPRAKEVLREFRNRMRRNTDEPQSMLQAMYSGEYVENIEANLLAALYNPKREPLFTAYMWGRRYNDLRFYVRPDGALSGILTPEEVALVNYDPRGKEEGIWYLSHLEKEMKEGTASSLENKQAIDAEHYRIETAIKGEKLTASCELSFSSITDGERVLRFGLLPTLRVSKVTWGEKELVFIQEKKDADSSFQVILPEALAKGQKYKIKIEYQGNKVIEDEGGGNFAVGARTSWYPSVNAFSDRATFDLTFIIPNKYVLVGVGKKVKEVKDGDFTASQWVSEIPLAVAGFNYGRFKKKEAVDEQAKYQIEGYATTELPDSLREAEEIGGMSPSRMIDKGVVEAQNSIRIFNHFFGEAPYGRIAITQQPQLSFGQSWPTLVYLPIISFFDSTQRWQMFGMQKGLTDFIQEVTSHEVAHQWWGHMVGWASYHDQWLSEGFADFSASLFLQHTEPKIDPYLKFWDRHRQTILQKNSYGVRPNDVGPIWMGQRLSTPKAPGAYNLLVYPKGSYVLHMLRWMMYDRQNGDKAFIEMMHDFVKTHFNRNASTESFKAIVEKHMRPTMDLDGNKKMDWFFSQWVYGTEVPGYKLQYTIVPENDGKVILKFTITQSEVSPEFKGLVPIYLDFDGKTPVKLGEASILGSTTTQEFQIKLPQRPKRVLINYHYDVLATESVSIGK
ncbi:MAG TPA: M1 family aminopeptidase [Blastocatellia bacterium]|nr:M1 family aminopeptidase [Blastocatellia bacterium]